MLRVGLTGGLGSGKSTVARLLAERGAHVLESDAMGRELMLRDSESSVYGEIVARFGSEVVRSDGELDRAALARIAFAEGRVEELNAIVHPAVLARQAELIGRIAASEPDAVVVIESALIFETKHGGKDGWRSRFDCVVLVTAPEEVKIERYVQRSAETMPEAQARGEAQRRLGHQIPDEQKIAMSDYVIHNDGTLPRLEKQVGQLWLVLQSAAR